MEPLRTSSAADHGHGGTQILLAAGPARFVGDVPILSGGLDLGPSPHDLVAAGLAACTAQTMRLYARRKGWALGAVRVEVTYRADPAATPSDVFDRRIVFGSELPPDQRARLFEIAEKCPVHRLLTGGASVVTTAEP